MWFTEFPLTARENIDQTPAIARMTIADPPPPLPHGNVEREDIPAARPKHKQRTPSLPLLLLGKRTNT
jgi:hypothetical protein